MDWLTGKKTYIVLVLSIGTLLQQVLTGEMSWTQAWVALLGPLTGLMAAFRASRALTVADTKLLREHQ